MIVCLIGSRQKLFGVAKCRSSFGPGERLGRACPGHTSLTLRKWARTQPLVRPTRRAIAQKMRFDGRNRAVVSAHAVGRVGPNLKPETRGVDVPHRWCAPDKAPSPQLRPRDHPTQRVRRLRRRGAGSWVAQAAGDCSAPVEVAFLRGVEMMTNSMQSKLEQAARRY